MKEIIVKTKTLTIEPKYDIYVADLVRCKECKHWTNGDDTYGICYRCANTRQMRYDDFCSYGSRSEKPNNSTISKMEQVETMSCAECKHRPIGAEICEEPCHYEPQTERSE